MRAYDGSATSLADALRYKGNLRWDQSLINLYRAGHISEDIFNANLLG
jgi:twitching motility protein PilT